MLVHAQAHSELSFISHSESFSLAHTHTHPHTYFFQDVILAIKPLAWFYSAAETSCRLSFPGSQSGSDMDTHTQTHTRSDTQT